MEKIVVDSLAKEMEEGRSVALVSVTGCSGSSPAKCGAMMLVGFNGIICGTVGGGSLEQMAENDAKASLVEGESRSAQYTLSEESDLNMSCGGVVTIFIKVFQASPRLIIVGGGHVGIELYKLALLQGYSVEVVDSREAIATAERFPEAVKIHCGDPAEVLQGLSFDTNSYITIATHSHSLDRMALAAVVESAAGYVGMIGSTRKIKGTLEYLKSKGVSRSAIEKLYTPMGLNVATIAPREIAVSIMAEILLVKNNGTAKHMRDVKKISL